MKDNLKIENLSLHLENEPILENINLDLESGELIILLGLNGAGKSTLLKSLVGILKQGTGKICYNNKELRSFNPTERAKIMAYLPQKIETNYNYKVRDFIELGVAPHANIFGYMKNSDIIIDEAIKSLDIEKLENKYIQEISGGELKLVYLARARVQKAKWLVLDEPTANLDFKREHEVLKKLKVYIDSNKIGGILSLHNPNMANLYGDRIIFIKDGRIIGDIRKKDENYNKEFERLITEIYGLEILELL